MLRELWLRLLLAVLRHERTGLRRERARYHSERLGLESALHANQQRDNELQRQIARLDMQARAQRTARRFPLTGA